MRTNTPVDPPQPPQARRIVMRRSRGGAGFSSGISTRSESLRDTEPAEPDEVDAAIDPNQVRDNIRHGQVDPPRDNRSVDSGMPPQDMDRGSLRFRLNQMALAGSSAFAKEGRLELLNRMLMRKIPLDQIAQQLNVSISTVEKDRAELKRRLREVAREMNIEEMVGGQSAFYDEVTATALRVATGGVTHDENGNAIQAVPTGMRLAALRTALAAKADQTRFYATAGVYDVLRFRRADDGTTLSDVQLLMNGMAEALAALREPEDGVAASAAAPVKPHGGFAPMSFNDSDASGSANEIQEI